MRNLITLLFVIITSIAYSQSIVNTEKALTTVDDKLHLNYNLSGNSIKGNVDINQLNTDLHIGIRLDTVHVFRAIAGISILQQNKKLVNNVGFVQARYNRILNERFRTFSFYQLQYNSILLLERRQLTGYGIRIDLEKDSSNFRYAFLIGAMYEQEILDETQLMPNEIVETNFLRTATSFSFKYDIKKVHIISTTYYQAHMSNFKDFRILNDTEINVKLNDHFSVFNVFEYRYDSKPPNMLNPYDFTNSVGLSIKI